MIYKYSSIYEVINKLYRDLDTPKEFPFEDCIEWAGEALDKIGAAYQYLDKVTGDLENPDLIIQDYRAELPCDFKSLTAIAINGKPAFYDGNTFYKIGDGACCSGSLRQINTPNTVFKDNFGNEYSDYGAIGMPSYQVEDRYKFNINDNYIFTNTKDGTICLAYKSIPSDSEGFPLIPDNVYYREAIVSYITKMLDYRRWRNNPSNDTKALFDQSNRDWLFYVGAAGVQGIMPDVSKMEKLSNDFRSLIPKIKKYNKFFK